MAFPTTSVIDDFNRGNSSTSLGANWSSPIESGYSSLGILSSQCYPSTGFNGNYWNTGFGADQEAYVTIPVLPGGSAVIRLFARIQNPGGSYSAYDVEMAFTGGTSLHKFVSGSGSYIGGGGPTLSAGDSIGIECIGTAITLYYKVGAGAWTVGDTTTDGDVTGSGYIGMHVGDTTAVRADNFGGGNSAGPSPRSQYLDYDYSRS